MKLGNAEGREMIDVLVGFIVFAIIYLLELVSGLFASAQIIAGKKREEYERKNLIEDGSKQKDETQTK